METASLSASFVSPLPRVRPGSLRLDLRLGSGFLSRDSWIQRNPSLSLMQLNSQRVNSVSRKRTVTRSSMQPSDYSSSEHPIAPLQLESPIGQFLSQILTSHVQLVPAAVEHLLEQLQTDHEAEINKEEPSASGTDLVLYRRIAEVKANERRKSLEEILYALVVHRFMDADVPLLSSIAPSPGHSDSWRSKDDKMEKLHSPEAYEMIQNHLALILGNRIGDPGAVAQISKLRVGQVYAASVMYGYFLKRVDQRFQLEKSMKVLPQGDDDTQATVRNDDQPHPEAEASPWSGFMGSGGFPGNRPSRLRAYVMSFDGEMIQRYATIRSKEAISIIEKHTEALFGRPDVVSFDSPRDDSIRISFALLRRLVLEAVTFGSFLWDVESYVNSRYDFVSNL